MTNENLSFSSDDGASTSTGLLQREVTELIHELQSIVTSPPFYKSNIRPSITHEEMALREERYKEIINRLESIGPPAITTLANCYKNDDWTIRYTVVYSLGEFGEPALETLAHALGDSDQNVRLAAIAALGRIGEAGLDILIHTLNDEDWNVRLATIKALGTIGEPALPILTGVLNEGDDLVEARTVHTIIDIGEPAINAIRFALDSKFPAVRREVVRDLTRRLSSYHIENSDSCIKKATIARLLAVALEDADGTLVKEIVDYLSGIEVEEFFDKCDLDPKDVINAVIDELVIRSSGRPGNYFNSNIVTMTLMGTVNRNPQLYHFVLQRLCDLAYQNENEIRDRAVAVARKLDAGEFATLVKNSVDEYTSATASIMRILGGSEASAFFTELIYQEFLKNH